MEDFFAEKISDGVFAAMQKKSYGEDCPVRREDLRLLHVLHKSAAGETRRGELICHSFVAGALLQIFAELYGAAYPIEKIRLIDEYDGDDERSMTDNNSSCFNFRRVAGSARLSKHGLGLAVDINPLYNPYVKETAGQKIVAPVVGAKYIDRTADFAYKITADDECCRAFFRHGFTQWGGDCWQDRQDWQHFALPDEVVQRLYPQVRI